MNYVNVTYKGGLYCNDFLNLTKNKTYKGLIKNDFLFIEDDESQKKNYSHKDLIPLRNCYYIFEIQRVFFDVIEL